MQAQQASSVAECLQNADDLQTLIGWGEVERVVGGGVTEYEDNEDNMQDFTCQICVRTFQMGMTFNASKSNLSG